MITTIVLLIATFVIAVVSIPMILKLVPRNPYYGFRTPATLSSDELWYPANRFAGWALLIAAAVSAGLMLLYSRGSLLRELVVVFVPFGLAVGACFVYLTRIKSKK